MSLEIHTLPTPGLGSTGFVLAYENSALVVDPQRDVERVTSLVARTGLDPCLVLETHVHNDFVSGGRLAADALDVPLVLPGGSGARYAHRTAVEGTPITAGPLTVQVLHTPGHTPEHVTYVVLADGEPVAVFSGGSLLSGSVGRSDLLGPDQTPALLRSQFDSVHRLASLPHHLPVYPTHGAGSFCSTSEAGPATTTIGHERRTNPFFSHTDAEAFAAAAPRSDEAPFPSYFAHMAPINRDGPTSLPTDPLPLLSPADVVTARTEGIHIVDTRPRSEVAAGRIPGSLAVELGPDFATWVGWLLPFDAPLVLVGQPDDELASARTALGRIGFDHVVGVLPGVDGWVAAGHDLIGHRVMTAREFVDLEVADRQTLDAQILDSQVLDAQILDAQILDVRASAEWDEPAIDGAVRIHLPDLVDALPAGLDPSRSVYVGCTTGHRASIAASYLADRGFEPVVLTGASLPGVAHLRARRTDG